MPVALEQLLDNLKATVLNSSVDTISQSHALIHLSGEPEPLRLDAQQCELLFDSMESTEQLYDSLNKPADAVIELHRVNLDEEVLESLNRLFTSVEET